MRKKNTSYIYLNTIQISEMQCDSPSEDSYLLKHMIHEEYFLRYNYLNETGQAS